MLKYFDFEVQRYIKKCYKAREKCVFFVSISESGSKYTIIDPRIQEKWLYYQGDCNHANKPKLGFRNCYKSSQEDWE